MKDLTVARLLSAAKDRAARLRLLADTLPRRIDTPYRYGEADGIDWLARELGLARDEEAAGTDAARVRDGSAAAELPPAVLAIAAGVAAALCARAPEAAGFDEVARRLAAAIWLEGLFAASAAWWALAALFSGNGGDGRGKGGAK